MSSKRSASLRGLSTVDVSRIRTARPARRPTHAAYPVVPSPATALPPGLHGAVLPPLYPDPDWLGTVLPPPLHHRVYLHRWSSGHRSLVPLPPLLLPLRLVA